MILILDQRVHLNMRTSCLFAHHLVSHRYMKNFINFNNSLEKILKTLLFKCHRLTMPGRDGYLMYGLNNFDDAILG